MTFPQPPPPLWDDMSLVAANYWRLTQCIWKYSNNGICYKGWEVFLYQQISALCRRKSCFSKFQPHVLGMECLKILELD